MKIYHAEKFRQALHRMSRASILTAASVLAMGLSSFGVTGIAHANAPSQICDFGSNSACLNRQGGCTSTSGSCAIISYNNDDDNNEYFDYSFLYLCNNYIEVTSTCPFTVGSGMNADNFGDQIVQLVAYNTSGQTIGCVGDTGNARASLLGCNGHNGTGGGQGTVFVLNNQNAQGGAHTICNFELANRYESNLKYANGFAYPVILKSIVRGSQLSTIGAKCTYAWN